MTEERYLLVFNDDGDVRIVDGSNGTELYAYQVCDLLNSDDRVIREQFVLIDKLEKRIKELESANDKILKKYLKLKLEIGELIKND